MTKEQRFKELMDELGKYFTDGKVRSLSGQDLSLLIDQRTGPIPIVVTQINYSPNHEAPQHIVAVGCLEDCFFLTDEEIKAEKLEKLDEEIKRYSDIKAELEEERMKIEKG